MSTYLERLELYFEANAVIESRKVSVLLTVNGAKAYSTLHSLVAPEQEICTIARNSEATF